MSHGSGAERRTAVEGSTRLEPERHDTLHPELDEWRRNVGEPVAFDNDVDAADVLDGLDVICWNVAIGLGRLEPLLEQLRAGAFGGVAAAPERPLVVLVQEAYRQGGSVPDASGSTHHGGPLGDAARHDIAEAAARCGFSLRYSPSMRNGRHDSDRGNAILSSVRLTDGHAFLLPHVRQRRVAVGAAMAGHPDLTFVSAHLDTHGRLWRTSLSAGAGIVAAASARTAAYRFAAGREAQARALGRTLTGGTGSVILGADLNTLLGVGDPALRALVDAGMHPARRVGAWRHTYHARIKLLLDHVLYRSGDGRITAIDVHRLDEAPGDRSSDVFGSDHHPLLARVDFGAKRPAH